MNSTIKWPSWFVLTGYWLGLVGVSLVTTAVISWLFVLPPRIQGHVDRLAFDRKAALHPLAWFFGVTTLLNALIGTKFTHRAVKHRETPQFRGESCHSRNPEFAYYLNSQCWGRQRTDSRDAAKHKLLEEASTPLPSPVAL